MLGVDPIRLRCTQGKLLSVGRLLPQFSVERWLRGSCPENVFPRRTAITVFGSELLSVSPATMRILLVEDHHDTRQVLTRLLIHWGFDVVPAESLESGLNHLESEPFDAILCDIALPDGTGYALVSEARRRGKDILAIALSGYSYPSEVHVAKLTGFDHHLSKPCDCQQLRSLLGETTDGKGSLAAC